MKILKSHIDKNGRLSIPAKIRNMLDLKAGDDVLISYTNSEIIVSNFNSNIEKARNILSKYKNLDLQKELKIIRSEDEK